MVWKNDSVEFTFHEVVALEESIQDDEMMFKATMKKGNNQIKEAELKVTLKTVSEEREKNNPAKEEKQEYYEQGSLLDPIKLGMSASKHSELIRKVEILTDSNRMLREEKEKVEKDNESLKVAIAEAEAFKGPMEEKLKQNEKEKLALQAGLYIPPY